MSGRPRRVLVTGAGGFIGGHVLAAAPADWEVVALSRRALPAGRNVSPARWSGKPGVPLPDELHEPFDATIHLAGNASHALASSEPWRDLAMTGGVAAAILSSIATRRVVLLSSAAVYAGLEGRVDPRLAVDPRMPYALSKRYVEGLVHALQTRGRIADVVTFRLYNAFGPGERPTRLIPRIAAAVRNRRPFELSGDPASLSDPVEVGWVAGALIAAAGAGITGTFDLCGGDPVLLADQVGRIAAVLGMPELDVELRPNPDEEPIRFWSDPGPAIEAFRLSRPTPFPDAVRDYARSAGWI